MGSAEERLIGGDTGALAEVYDRYGKGMYHYALSLLLRAQDAEDAVQTVMARLVDLVRSRSLRAVNLKAYLFRAVRNESLSMLEKRRHSDEKTRAKSEQILQPRTSAVSPLSALQVGEALEKLPAEQREAVTLKLFEGFTFREIAEATGEKLDTVASRYKYGIRKLEDLLDAS
jgi:RNA polymerase sigma-70 factor (ECF subfamily)